MPPVSNTRQLRAFARTLQFTLRVPGSHDGLSNDALMEILASDGRDFAADSPRLREHILSALMEQFAGDNRAPGLAQLRQIASAAIVEWVVRRFSNGLRDVPIKSNSAKYRQWKRAHAPYSAPGMLSGALRNAVRDRATARIK